jgi:hypothetical protein
MKKIKTHTLSSVTISENLAVCGTKWKNVVHPDRPQMKIWRMRINAGYLRLQKDTENMQ